jgi:hypothetical protein
LGIHGRSTAGPAGTRDLGSVTLSREIPERHAIIATLAVMLAPVARPAQDGPSCNHGAAEVGSIAQPAKRRSPVAAGRSGRAALHGASLDPHMSGAERAARTAQDVDQRLSRLARTAGGAGLICSAGLVGLASGDARNPQSWSFCAPYRAIPIPDRCGSAIEGQPGRNDGGGYKGEEAHRALMTPGSRPGPVSIASNFAQIGIFVRGT